MALSGEEARNIGKEAAEKVLKTAQGCHCGVAMWDARTNINSLEAVINFQRSDWLQPISRLQQDTLTIVEQDCGVDMSKPKELAQRLQAEIKSEDWSKARVNLALLRESIVGPLQKCATEKE